MRTRKRLLDVFVPNATSREMIASLVVRPVDPSSVEGLLPVVSEYGRPLEYVSFGISDPETDGTPQAELQLSLGPFQDKIVRFQIETIEPEEGQTAIAAFQLADYRGGTLVGGVTVVCTTPPYFTEIASSRDPENACPLVLTTEDLTFAYTGTSPEQTVNVKDIQPEKSLSIVAVVENPGKDTVTGASVYIEHLGRSNVGVEGKVWNIGTIEPGQRFWAMWQVDASNVNPGHHEASFIFRGDGYSPIRRRGRFLIRATE